VAPRILARVALADEPEPAASWTHHRLLTTVTDMIVIAVGPSGQAPRAVVKLPATEPAACGLARERDVLAALHGDARLGDWRATLPAVVAEGHLDGRPYVVERFLPGVAMSRVAKGAGPAKPALAAAAAAIGELHRRTAAPATVDDALLERWIDAPALVLRGAGAADGGRGAAIERLARELREQLAGRTLPVSWVHADFVPGNILVAADGGSVTGIVDWELASSAGLPEIDTVALLLAARAQRRRREPGQVVRELLIGAHWTEFEQNVLDSARSRLPGAGVDARTTVLLWWLGHVAANLTKATRYGHGGAWARWNIQIVLDALGRR
jgi:aminoglycoside phosphotransferase (APT) family kinase protein